MAPQPQQEDLFREGRNDLAKEAIKSNRVKSVRAAADAFDVKRTTLRRRIDGILPKRGSIAPNRLLTPTEEQYLIQRILSMDRRGMPPTVAATRAMASALANQHGKAVTVGKNWVYKFVGRTPDLKSKYNRKYDYQRALCEDPALIRAWFQRVRQIVAEYGILDEDIYNFDETSFQIGVIATAKVVTGADRAGKPRSIQPGNREWVTVIEAINGSGLAIPPLIILEAIIHQGA
jgi:hypothetical protein